jgi:hypothetical protein
MGRTRRTHDEKRFAYRVLAGKPEVKRLLGRPTLRCEDNVKLDVTEIR